MFLFRSRRDGLCVFIQFPHEVRLRQYEVVSFLFLFCKIFLSVRNMVVVVRETSFLNPGRLRFLNPDRRWCARLLALYRLRLIL